MPYDIDPGGALPGLDLFERTREFYRRVDEILSAAGTDPSEADAVRDMLHDVLDRFEGPLADDGRIGHHVLTDAEREDVEFERHLLYTELEAALDRLAADDPRQVPAALRALAERIRRQVADWTVRYRG